jgi:hypothetical protein
MTVMAPTSCVRGACMLALCAGLAALSGCGNAVPDGAGAPSPLARLSADAGVAPHGNARVVFADSGEGIAHWQINDGSGTRTMVAAYDPLTGWSRESGLEIPPFAEATFVAGRSRILVYWRERVPGEDRAWVRVLRDGLWSDPVLLAAGPYSQSIRAASPLGDGFQVLLIRSSVPVPPGDGGAPPPTPGPFLFVYDADGWHDPVPLPEPPSTGSPLYDLRDPRWVFSDVERDDQLQGVRLLAATGDAETAGDWTVVAERTDGINFSGDAEACGAGALAVWWDWDPTGTVWRRHARRFMDGAWGGTLDLGELPIEQARSSLVYPIVPRVVPGPAGCLLQLVTSDGTHLQLTAEVFSDTGSQRRVLVENLDNGGELIPLGNRDGYAVWWTEEMPQGIGTRLRTLHADMFQDGAWVGDHVVDSHEIQGPYEAFYKLLLAPHGHGAAVRTPDGDVVVHLFRGGTWLAPTVLVRQQPSLDLALGGDGDVVAAVWVDTGTDPPNTDVRVRMFADGAWDTPRSLLRQPHPCSHGNPLLAVTPSRRAVAVWGVACREIRYTSGHAVFATPAAFERARYAVRDRAGNWSDPKPVSLRRSPASSLVAAGERVFLVQLGPEGITATALDDGGPGAPVRLSPEGDGLLEEDDPAPGLTGSISGFVAQAEGGRVAVVWTRFPVPDFGTESAVFANVFDGGSWRGPVLLAGPADLHASGERLLSGSGLTAIWREERADGCAFRSRTYDGGAWGDAVTLMENGPNRCGTIRPVANDRGYLAWWFEDDGSGNGPIRGRRFVNGRWGDPVTLVPASREPAGPMTVAGTGDTFLLVVNTDDAGAASVIARRFDGEQWTDIPGIGAKPGNGFTELRVIPGAGGYLVRWRDVTFGTDKPSYVRVLDGGAWGEALNLTEAGYLGSWLAVADGDGFVTPLVRGDEPYQVFAMRYRFGVGWGSPEPLPGGEEDLGLPELVVRDGTHPLAVWSRPDPDGDPDVLQIWAGGF